MILKKIAGVGLAFLIICTVAVYFLRHSIERRLQARIPQLEAVISEAFGAQVKFGAIQSRMNGLVPEIDVEDMSIASGMTFKKLNFQMDLFQSLLKFRPQIKALVIADTKIALQEGPSSQWGIVGISSKGSADDLLKWFSTQLILKGKNIQIVLNSRLGHSNELSLEKGVLEWDLLSSSFEVHLGPFEIRAPGFWLRPTAWKKLDLDGQWISAKKLLQVNHFGTQTAQARFEGGMKYQWSDGQLSLNTRILSAEIPELRRLIPTVVLPSSIKLWMDTALHEGKVQDGRWILQGFPGSWKNLSTFDGNKQKFELVLPVRDLKLDYSDGWPALSSAVGVFKLQNQILSLDLEKAEAEKIHLQQAHAKIENVSAEHLLLSLGMNLTADAGQDIAKWIPLSEWFKPTGSFQAQLQLELPLANEGVGKDWKGKADIFKGGFHVLKFPEWDFHFDEVQGKIEFSEKDVFIPEWKAMLFDRPSRLSVKYQKNSRGVIEGQFDLDSVIEADKVAEVYPEFPVEDILSGEISSHLKMHLNRASEKTPFKTSLEWKSDLVATEIQAPEPFDKNADEKLETQILAEVLGEDLTRLQVSFKNPLFHLKAVKTSEALALSGQLDEFQTDAWWNWWKDLDIPKEESFNGPLSLDMKFDELKWKDSVLHQAGIEFEKTGGVWKAKVQSEEAVGQLNHSGELLEARFKSLKFPEFPWNRKESQSSAHEETNWDLKAIPSLSIRSDQVEVEGRNLGNFRAEVEQTGKSLVLHEFIFSRGEWDLKLTQGESSDSKTSFAGVIGLHDTVPPVRFKSMSSAVLSQGSIQFKASWPGSIDRFSFLKTDAEVEGRIPSGKLMGVKSGIQSVFNFLSMSWSDSRKQMMRFTKMFFQIQIKDGEILTQVGRALFGSVYLKVSGPIQISTGAVKMKAEVTPAVEEIGDDPSQELEEAHNILSHSYKIGGVWPDLDVSLKVF